MKKLNSVIIAFLLLLSTTALNAQNEVKVFKVGDLYYTTFAWAKGVGIVKPSDGSEYNLEEITIPSTVSDGTTEYDVTKVTENVFKDNLTLKKVNFPETKLTLEGGAFQNSGLTSLTLLPHVINYGAFTDLNQLEVLEYAEGITTTQTVSSTKIHTIKLSTTIRTVYSFTKLPALTTIELPVNDPYLIDFRPKEFSFTDTPIEQVTLKVPLQAVEDYKNHWAWSSVNFKAIEALPRIFPDPVKEPEALGKDFRVGDLWYIVTDAEKQEVAVTRDGLMDGAKNYPGFDIVEVPSSITYNTFTYTVTAVGDNAFDNNNSIQQVFLPESVTKIGESAFQRAPLTYIEMPGVVEIGKSAFRSCKNLTSITFPSTLTTLNDGVFEDSGLTEVTVPGILTGYDFARAEALATVVLEEGITEVPNYAFSGCSALTSVSLPSTLTKIGEYAFHETALTSITLPAALTSIGEYAFFKSAITSIEFPASVTSIGSNAFYGTKLTSVTLPAGIKEIGAKAFDSGDASSSYIKTPLVTDIYLPVADPSQVPLTGGYPVQGNFRFDKKTVTLHVPVGSEEAYQAAEKWKDYTIVGDIKSSVREVLTHGIEAYGAQGMLYITTNESTEAVSAAVYSITGSLLRSITLSGNNTYSLPLSAGTYIVKVGNGAKRVVVW